MVDSQTARAKVRSHLGSEDFELEEFPEGWRVIRPIPEGMMGTATLAVERVSGDLLSFASAVPPERVSEEFEQVRRLARVVEGTVEPGTSDDSD